MVKTTVNGERKMDEKVENLGPASAMQIRDVPKAVRKFWGDWARSEEKTVGQVFVTHSLGLMGGEVATPVKTVVNQTSIDDLCRVVEVCERFAATRRAPEPGKKRRGGKESTVANRALTLLNIRLVSELGAAATTVSTTVNKEPQPLFETTVAGPKLIVDEGGAT